MNLRIDLSRILFEIAYLLCMFAVICVAIKICLDERYEISFLCLLIGISVLLMTVYMKSGYNHLLYFAIIVLGLRGIDIEKIIKVDFIIKTSLMVFIIVCSMLGVIDNYITYRTASDVLRYSMGFNHPNTLASLVFSLVMEDSYLRKGNISMLYCLIV